MSDELTGASASWLAGAIRAGEVSPVEITDAALSRIERVDGALGAFVTVTPELARASARGAERRARAGELRGPLDGIPFSLKDLELTDGIRTTFGSRFHAELVPDRDSVVAGRLRASGGSLLGKTNTPQFGYKDACDNLVAAPTVNPWDTTRNPGGSSGGAAAAVAAGLGPVAQGSDGAGSIRIPASLCGVVGLKPTFGRVPVAPSTDYWAARVHNGPIARSVADVAMLLGVMAGADPADPLSIGDPGEVWTTGMVAVPDLRVAFSADFGYGAVDPEVADACRHAATLLETMGASVQECDPTWDDPGAFHRVLYSVGLGTLLADRLAAQPDWVEPTLRELVELGLSRSARELKEAEIARAAFHDQARAFFERFDVLVCPTMPIPAWPLTTGEGPLQAGGRTLTSTQRRALFVYPFNLTGQPALTIPCARTEIGLPIGVQIVARRGRDDIVLAVGAALEQVLGFGDRPAPVIGTGDAVVNR